MNGSLAGLRKDTPQSLSPKEYIAHTEAMSAIALREKAVIFLFFAYGGLLLSTVAIIFFQGFHVFGFNLDIGFLKWLGAATVGEVAGIAMLVYKALFKRDDNK